MLVYSPNRTVCQNMPNSSPRQRWLHATQTASMEWRRSTGERSRRWHMSVITSGMDLLCCGIPSRSVPLELLHKDGIRLVRMEPIFRFQL